VYADYVRPALILLSLLLLATSLTPACGGVSEELLPFGQEAGAPPDVGVGATANAGGADNQELTADQIRQLIINDSIAAYDGPCPCPYNIAAGGSQCGKRSAYSRAGGADPICFFEQVTEAMLAAYRQHH